MNQTFSQSYRARPRYMGTVLAMMALSSPALRAQDSTINGNVGIGVAASSAARLRVNQSGASGVGIFAGNLAPVGQAIIETNLSAPATHLWFAENGSRVFSVAGGGDGYFNGSLSFGLGQTRQLIDLWGPGYGIGIQDFAFYQRTARDFYWYAGGAHNVKSGDPGGGNLLMHLGSGGVLTTNSMTTLKLVLGTPPATSGNFAGSSLSSSLLDVWGGDINLRGRLISTGALTAPKIVLGTPPATSGNFASSTLSSSLLDLWGGDINLHGQMTATGDLSIGGSQFFGKAPRQMLNLYGSNYGIGVQDFGLYQRSEADFFWYKGGQQRTGQDGAGGGVALMHLDKDGTLFAYKVQAGVLQASEGGRVITPVLQITGGSDVAEPFQMSGEEIPKGSVVIIDEENPGRLKLSGQAYDTRVAGVVSGANGINPGISLSQRGVLEGGQDVALSGRVYVLTDASYDPIRPGDLLTTSDTPGQARKATDHARSQGAIIGKAMTALPEGNGMVLVLVSLQ